MPTDGGVRAEKLYLLKYRTFRERKSRYSNRVSFSFSFFSLQQLFQYYMLQMERWLLTLEKIMVEQWRVQLTGLFLMIQYFLRRALFRVVRAVT